MIPKYETSYMNYMGDNTLPRLHPEIEAEWTKFCEEDQKRIIYSFGYFFTATYTQPNANITKLTTCFNELTRYTFIFGWHLFIKDFVEKYYNFETNEPTDVYYMALIESKI
jgi:hypothetical protein